MVSRGELVDAVWGDQPPASAEGGIYTYVAGLRRVIEPDRPRRDPDRSRQSPPKDDRLRRRRLPAAARGRGLDADHFGRCLAAARGLRADCDLDGALQAVDEALALWRGLPYAGVPGPFAEAEQRRLTELRTTAIEERADLLLARVQAAAAVPELTALTAAHPLREQTTGLLMIALYRCGRQAEALRVFGETRERLAEDLGIDPGGERTRIHRQLLAMDPALDGPVTPLRSRSRPRRAIRLTRRWRRTSRPDGSALARPAAAPPGAGAGAEPGPVAARGGRLRRPDRRAALAARAAAGRRRPGPGRSRGDREPDVWESP